MQWFSRLIKRRQLDRQLGSELQLHLDLLASDLEREGFTREQARREAELRFGGVTGIQELCRDARGTARVESIIQDIRHGLRVLAKTPGATSAGLIALALGIGASTIIFSAVHTLLLKPLPYPNEQRLYMFFGRIPGEDRIPFSSREFKAWQTGQQSMESLGAYVGNGFTLTGAGEPLAVLGSIATPGLFDALGVRASVGRVFHPDEAKPGHDHVVVLSNPLWRDRFSGSLQVIGQSVNLNGEPYTVIGVMPPSFTFPESRYLLWVPATLDGGLAQKFPDAHMFRIVGRLRAATTASKMSAEVEVLSKRVAALEPNSGRRIYSIPLTDVVRGNLRQPLWALFGAVGLVLLIACANVASLLLARATGRSREFAIRVSLGAGRARLVQQMLVESTLLALTGGGIGLIVAIAGVKFLQTLGSAVLPGIEGVGTDWAVLGFSIALALATGLISGLMPAVLTSQRATHGALRQRANGTTDRHSGRMQNALVVIEVALSITLFFGAGLLIQSFINLSLTSPGFRQDRVLTASVSLSEQSYPSAQNILRFYRLTLEELGNRPGMDSVALVTHLPFSGQSWGNGYEVEGRPAPPRKPYVAQIRPISPGYFQTLGISFRYGGGFTSKDRAENPGVAVINDSLAHRFWPNESAVGKRIRFDDEWLTIRGVIADVKHQQLDAGSDPEIYVPYEQLPPNLMKFLGRGLFVVAHGSLGDKDMALSLRSAVHAVDPALAIRQLVPLGQLVSQSIAQPKFRAVLLGVFSAMALVLASLGIYSVMSYLVGERTQEMGVRLALGAPPNSLVRLVFGRALTLTLGGIVAGLVGSILVFKVLRGLLFGVAEHDPLTFVIAAAVLLFVTLVASVVPARRAAAVDPLLSLRAD